MAGGPPTVLVVEDDALCRRTLARLMRTLGATPTEAGTIASAECAFGEKRPAGIVTDEGLPDGSGTAWLADLRDRGYIGPALVLTGRSDSTISGNALVVGAFFANKPIGSEHLLAFLRHVTLANGGALPQLATCVEAFSKAHELTDRETAVLHQLVRGLTLSGAAENLRMSLHTAKQHSDKIRSKSDTGSIHELVQVVLETSSLDILGPALE